MICINAREANVAYPIWVLSQHSVVQSISKNTVPFAYSVHINISIIIDSTGIYKINPNPKQRSCLIRYTKSVFGNFTIKIARENSENAKIEYTIYIYVYIISSDRFKYVIG